MNKNEEQEIEIDLKEIIARLLDHIWIILLTTFICAGAALGVTKVLMTPKYTSTSKVYILSKSQSLSSLSLSDLQIGAQLTQDYMVLVKSRPVLEKVIDDLQLDMKYEGLCSILSLSNPANTRILEFSIEYPDPYMAKQIVDKVAEVSRKQIAEIMDMEQPNVVEEGTVAENPSSPNTMKNTLLGAVLGFILCSGVIIARYLLNDTLNSEDDVEKYLGVPVLGAIPLASSVGNKRKNA